MSVFIALESEHASTQLADIVQRWHLHSDPEAEFSLSMTTEGLELRSRIEPKMGAIKVDFSHATLNYRRQQGGGRSEAIAKAVGIKGRYRPTVIDATAGLGRDAFILASLGCHVTMFERNPVVAALLEDGLRRAANDPMLASWLPSHLTLVYGHSQQMLTKLPQQVDVVYLDPMFPHRQKSALVKKEMRCFQQLVGADSDSNELLIAARSVALTRVVVKRPIQASFLTDIKPSGMVKMKKHRFDIYTVSS